jgi:electron transfer flavoprotein beta subunit
VHIDVFVKPVPEAETRLRPSADGSRLDPDGVKWVLSGYDESAVEQALIIKEATPGAEVRAITFGPAPRSEEVLRACLALGCTSASWVESPAGEEPDLRQKVRALGHAAKKWPAELYLLGQQSLDSESGMLPLALAAALGVPGASGAVGLTFDPNRSELAFERASDAGVEEWHLPVPSVIGLKQAKNDPRTAKLQNILKSRKMPIDRVPATEIAAAEAAPGRAVRFRFELPPPRTGAKLIEYATPEEAAEKLVRILREEAKVFP